MARRATTHGRAKGPVYEQVRRLEKLEGGGTFFYEVSRQEKWVVVKSGRVNLPGQTRMREYPTPAAAGVAMERLIQDRLGEGWMDPADLAEHVRKLEEQARAREAARTAEEGATRPRRAPKATGKKRPRPRR